MKKEEATNVVLRVKRLHAKYFKAYTAKETGNYRSSVLYTLEELLPNTNLLTTFQLLEIRNICQGIYESYKRDCEGFRRCNTLLINFSLVYNRRHKRGRPSGYKLSAESKRKISVSKTGQKHSKETRKKISVSVKKYHKEHPEVAESMSNFWQKNPGFRLALSDFMKAMWEENKT